MDNVNLIIAILNLATELLRIIREYISKNKRTP